MAFNRYQGNSGQVTRMPDGENAEMRSFGIAPPADRTSGRPETKKSRPPAPVSPLIGGISGLLNKLNFADMETDDLLMLLILYLMYRESGDQELLIIMGAMFLL